MHSAPNEQSKHYNMMNVSEKEFQFMLEDITSDMIQMLINREHCSLPQAVEKVYNSGIYNALQRPTSGLYTQSSGYVYSLLENELKSSVNGQYNHDK